MTPQTVPKFDSESAFFSGETQQAVKPSKQSILQLYNSPGAVQSNPLPASFTSQQSSSAPSKPSGPNYNVVLPGIGMPAVVPTVPQNSLGIGSNLNGVGSIPTGVSGYQSVPNYYNQGANFVGYRAPVPPGGFVNTNGYVNASYQQAQQAKFM